MRRPARGQQQESSSLFPFLAVLLCTMGALVVLLIAMAHVSRERASREAATALAEEEARQPDPAEQQRIAQAKSSREQASQVRDEALQRLRDEQAHLAGVEDHLRRLNDEMESLKAEAMELIAMEREHDDDQEAAQQELARRRENIAALEEEIDELKQQAASQSRRYAIVPLRDATNGTRRPPIYFECRADGVVLQPEGIHFPQSDLRFGDVSSPLLAADRAIRGYYEERAELFGASSMGVPYVLFVIRPDGVVAQSHAVMAFERANADYGSQPVAESWEIQFGQPNPELAQRVAMAVEQARLDRERLAAAAPQLFKTRRRGMIAASPTEPKTDYTKPTVDETDTWTPFDRLAEHASRQAAAVRAAAHRAGPPQRALGGGGEGGTGPNGGDESATSPIAAAGPTEGALGGPQSQGSTTPNSTANSTEATAANQASPLNAAMANLSKQHGAGRGRKGKPEPDGIPIRRTVNLVVSNDRVTIVPDRADPQAGLPGSVPTTGATIDLAGPTVWHIEAVASALQQHARSWGLAGPDMHWKPLVQLNVTSDGGQRAEEISEHLRAVGLRVQHAENAIGDSRGADAPLKR